MTTTPACLFCHLPPERIVLSNAVGMVIRDGFPVSPGHTLVMPRRHVTSFFGLTEAEGSGLFELVSEVQAALAAELRPDGFNIGINDGAAAGKRLPWVQQLRRSATKPP